MRIYHIILLSTILNSVALIAAAFSPNITCMSIMFGAIHGFGMGLFTTSAGIYILLYFYKYRATALSIFYGVGWAVAGIVGQLILSGPGGHIRLSRRVIFARRDYDALHPDRHACREPFADVHRMQVAGNGSCRDSEIGTG
ncbi:hypothetical protein MRX96_040305 [Rhipicephalus microplus]